MSDEAEPLFDLQVHTIGGNLVADRPLITWTKVCEILGHNLANDFLEEPRYAPQVKVTVRRAGSEYVMLIASPPGFIDPFKD